MESSLGLFGRMHCLFGHVFRLGNRSSGIAAIIRIMHFDSVKSSSPPSEAGMSTGNYIRAAS